MAAGQSGQGVDLGRRLEPGAASLPGEGHPDRPLQPLDRELLLVEEVGGTRRRSRRGPAPARRLSLSRIKGVARPRRPAARAKLRPSSPSEPMLDQGDVVPAAQEPRQPVLRVGGMLDQERAVLRPRQQVPHQQHIVLEVVDEQDPRRRTCRRGSLGDRRRHRRRDRRAAVRTGPRPCRAAATKPARGRRLRQAVVARSRDRRRSSARIATSLAVANLEVAHNQRHCKL